MARIKVYRACSLQLAVYAFSSISRCTGPPNIPSIHSLPFLCYASSHLHWYHICSCDVVLFQQTFRCCELIGRGSPNVGAFRIDILPRIILHLSMNYALLSLGLYSPSLWDHSSFITYTSYCMCVQVSMDLVKRLLLTPGVCLYVPARTRQH